MHNFEDTNCTCVISCSQEHKIALILIATDLYDTKSMQYEQRLYEFSSELSVRDIWVPEDVLPIWKEFSVEII
jgi:hypothetical protein